MGNSTLLITLRGANMKNREIGLLTSELKIFMGMDSEDYGVLISKEPDSGKWSIRMAAEKQEASYFLQRQRGGQRLFSHLEGAVQEALERFEGVRNLAIDLDGQKFFIEGANMSNLLKKLERGPDDKD